MDEFHPKATRTLFIGNLEKDVTPSELRKHFEQFGDIIVSYECFLWCETMFFNLCDMFHNMGIGGASIIAQRCVIKVQFAITKVNVAFFNFVIYCTYVLVSALIL